MAEAPVRSMLDLEGPATLAVIILVISAIWRRLTKDPEEDDP